MRGSLSVLLPLCCLGFAWSATHDDEFEELADRYVEEFAKFSPVGATGLGDHRYDDQLDNVDPQSRDRKLKWLRNVLSEVDSIAVQSLTRANQVDLALLKNRLRSQI